MVCDRYTSILLYVIGTLSIYTWFTHCYFIIRDPNTANLLSKYCYFIHCYSAIHDPNTATALYVIFKSPDTYQMSGVLVSVLTTSVVYRGFEFRSCRTKDYKIDICCFSAKHTISRSKNKDWLARNKDNVSEWGVMCTHGLLLQWSSTIKIQLKALF